MSNKGSLIVFAGCMFSGKTDLLISYLLRAPYAKHRTVLFSPKENTRDAVGEVRSRTGCSHPATLVSSAADILDYVVRHSFRGVVGIEEVQFFGEPLIAVIHELLDRNITVVVSGLDTDFFCLPYGIVPHLLAIADDRTTTTAFCAICGEKANRSQYLGELPADGNYAIDDGTNYEARCRVCHEPPRRA